jgi:hypothetical protein
MYAVGNMYLIRSPGFCFQVVFDVEQNRFGFAPVDCNTLRKLLFDHISVRE